MEFDGPRLVGNGELRSVFNWEDYVQEDGYVTLAMLKNYANVLNINFFRATQIFQLGFTFYGAINNVTDTVFDYLKNITSDVQDQFNAITNKIKNLVYDATTDTQGFSTTLWVPNLVTNGIRMNNLNANTILTNNLQSNNLTTNTLQCQSIIANNIPSVFINGYPIIKSGLLNRLNGLVTTGCIISLYPNTEIHFYNSRNIRILFFANTTDDILYFSNVNLSNVVSFVIFKNQ